MNLAMTTVRPDRPGYTNAMFGVTARRTCFVVDGYWRNGEGWYELEDAQTGERFHSPDVFWVESKRCPICRGVGEARSPRSGELVTCSRCVGEGWVAVE